MKVNAEIIMCSNDNTKEVLISNLISAFYKNKDKYLSDDDFLPENREVEIKITISGKEDREVEVEEFINWVAEEFDFLSGKLKTLENAFEKVFDR